MMTMTTEIISPRETQKRLREGAQLIDIREANEYRREHIADARLFPLSAMEQGSTLQADAKDQVIYHCQSGNRTRNHLNRLIAAAAPSKVAVLDGGLQAWKQAGLETVVNKGEPLPLMRQVQIVAGLLTLSGVILGYTVSEGFYLLSAFVGAGLTFAGISGFCGMARLLALMPWNRS